MLSNSMILGCEILDTAEISINREGAKIKRTPRNDVMEADIAVMAVETINERELDIGIVSDKNRARIENLVHSYEPRKIKSSNVTMNIILSDEKPIYSRPRRLPFYERDIVDNQVAKWLEEGIIEHSNSDYASPVVVVKKKDGVQGCA